jgi:hypothetical protein
MSVTRASILRAVRLCSMISPIFLGESACTSVGSPDWVAQRAVIQDPPAEPLSLTLPAAIRAGATTAITLRTIGGRYCTRLGPTQVTAAGMLVTLEPYDSVYVGELDCPTLPWDFAHTVDITFPVAGRATLRVAGRQRGLPDVVTVDTVLDVQ